MASASLSALLKNVALDDHNEILKAANSALKANTKDTTARLARVVSLLNLDRFDDAVRAFDDGGEALQKGAPLEHAYALYKTERLLEAQNTLRAVKEQDQSLLHMIAQVAYRKEDFSVAAEVYQRLVAQDGHNANEESDLRINQSAVDAQVSWSGQGLISAKKQPGRRDLEQFETAFNTACGYMARGDTKQAHFLLTRARDLCNAAEELSAEEKRSEVAPIEAQLICVLCQLGKYEEAKKITQVASSGALHDNATQSIAKVNSIVASANQLNPYLAERAFNTAYNPSSKRLFFDFQNAILLRNSLTVDLHAHKFGVVAKRASENAWAGAHAAAAHARNRTGAAAIKELVQLLEKHPNDVGLLMTIVQLYALTDNIQTGVALLENFLSKLERSTTNSDQDARFSPGLVGLTVSLYAGQNRVSSAKAELLKAAQHWRRKPKDSPSTLPILRAAGAALLESHVERDENQAYDLFEFVEDQTKVDEVTAAGLAASHVSSEQTDHLPSIDSLIKGVDVSVLDASGAAKLEKQAAKVLGSKRAADEPSKPAKRKRIRKSKLPKEYDPNKTPDPERWLPLRDRTSHKPKGKKKVKAAQAMSTQGGMTTDEARPSTPQQTQQSKAGAGSKMKKKKGKGK